MPFKKAEIEVLTSGLYEPELDYTSVGKWDTYINKIDISNHFPYEKVVFYFPFLLDKQLF